MVDSCDDDDFEADYEKKIGYRNPPKHTRWPKGVSGNPGGGPRKIFSRKHTLLNVAQRQIDYSDGSEKVRTIVLEAIVLIVKNAAISGNRAAQKMYERLQGITEPADDAPAALKGVLFAGERLSPEEWDEQGRLYQAGLPNMFGDRPIVKQEGS